MNMDANNFDKMLTKKIKLYINVIEFLKMKINKIPLKIMKAGFYFSNIETV